MKSEIRKSFTAAFPKTIPIIPGYVFMGIAFGILFVNLGYAWYWPMLMGLIIYAGMAQFVSVNMLVPGVSLLNTFLFQFALNARHIFYGLSMLEKFKSMGKLRPYMVFALTDETYSLLCSVNPPEGVSPKHYLFFIAFLDQCYWVLGCFLGGIAGSFITFNTTGIDFSMTALFITIVIDQWKEVKEHIPVFCGFSASLLCLFLLGADRFIIPALLCITACLLLFRRRIEKTTVPATANENETGEGNNDVK
ncbi:MAG: AzlC family ABC transporter permease [Clostridia bacterium]